MSLFFTPGSESIGASVSSSVLPMNIHSWFPCYVGQKRVFLRNLTNYCCQRLTNTKIMSPSMISSVQFSSSVMSDSLRPHEPQHVRPPCPSPTPRVMQTHVLWVGDAIQPSHPLSSPCSPTFNLSQHQGLFKWVSSLYQVAKVLEIFGSVQKHLVGTKCLMDIFDKIRFQGHFGLDQISEGCFG